MNTIASGLPTMLSCTTHHGGMVCVAGTGAFILWLYFVLVLALILGTVSGLASRRA